MAVLLLGALLSVAGYHAGSLTTKRAVVRASVALNAGDAGVQSITGVDDFREQVIDSPESSNIKVVKFVADRCRGCIAMRPKFDALAKAHASDVHFFEVDFKQARDVFGRESVGRTPTVLFYASSIGRVGGFAFGPTPASGSVLKTGLDQVLERTEALAALSPSALKPVLRYKALVSMLRAVASAGKRLEEDAQSRGLTNSSFEAADAQVEEHATTAAAAAAAAAAAVRAAAQAQRAANAAALFDWLDREGRGVLGAAEVKTAVDALGGGAVFTGRIGAGGGSGLPFEPIELDEKLRAGLEASGDAVSGGLRRDAFINLMLLHLAHERATLKPEAEARAAFALLDAEGSGGAVPTALAADRIAGMCARLPLGNDVAEGEVTAPALEALFETFDYEQKGHVHFECFARITERSEPTAW